MSKPKEGQIMAKMSKEAGLRAASSFGFRIQPNVQQLDLEFNLTYKDLNSP